MIAEWELWACANLLVEQRGDEAEGHALSRAKAFEHVGDREGAATWRRIASRIASLQARPGTVQ